MDRGLVEAAMRGDREAYADLLRTRGDRLGSLPRRPTVMASLLSERSTEADRWSWGIATGELQRLIFVDIGPGQTVLVGIDTNQPPTATRFDELVAKAMPVIATFEFPE